MTEHSTDVTPLDDDHVALMGRVMAAEDESRRLAGQLEDAKAALDLSEERLRDLALSTADWIWEVGADGRYTSCSDRVTEVLGYTPQEMIGRTPFDSMLEEDAERLEPVFAAMVQERRGCAELINRNRHKDGHEVVLLTSCVPITDESGALTGFRGVDKDITLREQMKAALRESEARYRSVFDLSPDAMVLVDRLSLRIVDANRAAASLYGYPLGDLLGLKITDLSAEPEKTRDTLTSASSAKGAHVPRRLHRTSSGTEIPVEVTSASLELGGRTLVSQVIRNVSERERRAGYVHAVSELQRRLLDAGEDDDLFALLLRPLLAATGADRIVVFENRRDEAGRLAAGQKAEITAPGVPPRGDGSDLTAAEYEMLGPEWSEPLRSGAPFAGSVDDLPPAGHDLLARHGVRSLLALPLMVHGAFYGHISCEDCHSGRVWDYSEVVLLATAATALSAALERRQSLSALRQRTVELTALLEASRAIAASIDYDEVLRRVAQAAGEALGSPECVIWEYSSAGDMALFRCLWERVTKPGVADSLEGTTYEITTHSGGLASLRAGVIVQQSRSDPDLPPIDRGTMDEWGEKTWLTVPLVFDRRLLGVMILIESERERDFTPDEVRMAGAIGEQAAVALNNALSHRKEEENNRWLRSLVDAGRAISAAPDPDTSLEEVARLAAAAVQAPAAFIYEYARDRDALVMRARCATPESRRDDAVGMAFPVGETPQDRRALDVGEVFVETISDPALPPEVRRLMDGFGELTLLNVPLRSRGEALGMLVLAEHERERVFTDEEQEFMAAFGEQVTLALTTARSATTDGLTGLANHRVFYDRLGQELARADRYGTPVSLLMIDLDDFKVLNDTYGHPAGDEVLRGLGRLLTEHLRRDVDLPARYGGEEFAIVLPSTAVTPRPDGPEDEDSARPDGGAPVSGHREGAEILAERLRATIAEALFPVGEDATPVGIAVSIGVASYPDMAGNMDELVARADAALYAAKRAGKNRIEVYWRRGDAPPAGGAPAG